jgi:hypothetical protein
MDRIHATLAGISRQLAWTAWWLGAPIDPRTRHRPAASTPNREHAPRWK